MNKPSASEYRGRSVWLLIAGLLGGALAMLVVGQALGGRFALVSYVLFRAAMAAEVALLAFKARKKLSGSPIPWSSGSTPPGMGRALLWTGMVLIGTGGWMVSGALSIAGIMTGAWTVAFVSLACLAVFSVVAVNGLENVRRAYPRRR